MPDPLRTAAPIGSGAVTTDICLWPARRQAAALRAKEISSRELLQLCLDREAAVRADVNAVVTLDVEAAIAAARDADEALAGGRPCGPLHGLPFTVKDAIETEGIRSTGGARELVDHVPQRDAPAVARLKAAGAVLYGKTNCPTWSGDIQTHNELFGVTRNPWDLGRTAGGSSGGAAAAVAVGASSFELGTDIGGSIRIPSAYCGVAGHKPTFGVVPSLGYLDRPGGGTIAADINVFGPIARDAGDLELLLGVLAGPAGDEAVGWRLELPPPRSTELAGLRIGTWFDEPGAALASDVATVLHGAADRLREAGAQVSIEERPFLDLDAVHDVYMGLLLGALSVQQHVAETLSHRLWLQMTEQRVQMRHAWSEYFRTYDVLLCPVMPMTAFPHDLDGDVFDRTVSIDGAPRPHMDCIKWAGLVGVAYLPSTVVPVGLTDDRLPVGVQIVAPYLEDRTALSLGRLLGDVLGSCGPPPLVEQLA